jgi:phospholipid-binding lipoprotein MlaA
MLQRVIGLVLLCALGGMVGGCATVGGNPDDPLERYNRAMFSFNDSVDKAFVKPVATGYKKVVPQFARTGVTNFFSNLGDIWIGINNILQGKIGPGVSDFGRFAINTTVGIAGLFDVASEAGLQKHNEDFGLTLGRWGMGSGPYVVLPLLGPSDVRDGLSLFVVDWHGDPLWYVNNIPTRNELIAGRFVEQRANLLDASRLMEEAALDPYAYVRSAYLQHRRSLVYDGKPPPEPDPGPSSKSNPGRASAGQAKAVPAPLGAQQEAAAVAAVSPRSYEPVVPRNYAAVLELSSVVPAPQK